MNKNSSWETSVKPVVVLSVIALIVSLLLAMVNSFTAPIIEDNQKAATLAAYLDVMPPSKPFSSALIAREPSVAFTAPVMFSVV